MFGQLQADIATEEMQTSLIVFFARFYGVCHGPLICRVFAGLKLTERGDRGLDLGRSEPRIHLEASSARICREPVPGRARPAGGFYS